MGSSAREVANVCVGECRSVGVCVNKCRCGYGCVVRTQF